MSGLAAQPTAAAVGAACIGTVPVQPDVARASSATTGSVRHELSFGLLASRVRNRFQDQAFNYVGTGNILGTAIVPADPALTDANTDRDERSTELSVQDAVRWNDRLTTWIGARHTRLDRDSIRTDGSASREIADIVVFLSSARASNVTGAAWSADGGTVPIIV